MRCQLAQGHEGLHQERFDRKGGPVTITWTADERERCDHGGGGQWDHAHRDEALQCPKDTDAHEWSDCGAVRGSARCRSRAGWRMSTCITQTTKEGTVRMNDDPHTSNGTSNGQHVTKKPAPSVISAQLRDELIRILQAGDDKSDGAFTVAVATQVERFAIAAREILMTEKLAQQDLASLMMMRRQHMGGMGLGGMMGSMNGWNSLVGGGDSPLPMPIVNNENFGVQAVRQIVDAARMAGESPAKLVEALVIARQNNLTDVVATLEKKLGVSKEPAEGFHHGERLATTETDGKELL